MLPVKVRWCATADFAETAACVRQDFTSIYTDEDDFLHFANTVASQVRMRSATTMAHWMLWWHLWHKLECPLTVALQRLSESPHWLWYALSSHPYPALQWRYN